MYLKNGKFCLAAWSWINNSSFWVLINKLKAIKLAFVDFADLQLSRRFYVHKKNSKPLAMVVVSSLCAFVLCQASCSVELLSDPTVQARVGILCVLLTCHMAAPNFNHARLLIECKVNFYSWNGMKVPQIWSWTLSLVLWISPQSPKLDLLISPETPRFCPSLALPIFCCLQSGPLLVSIHLTLGPAFFVFSLERLGLSLSSSKKLSLTDSMTLSILNNSSTLLETPNFLAHLAGWVKLHVVSGYYYLVI